MSDKTRSLNLDDMTPSPAYVTLDGKEHEITAASVETWLTFVQKRAKLEEMAKLVASGGSDENAAKIMAGNAEIITAVCPGIPEERLMRLTLPQLRAFVEFVAEEMRATAEQQAMEVAPEGEPEGEVKKETME